MKTFIVVLLFFLFILFDYLPQRTEGGIKEKAVYWSLLSAGFVVLILYTFDIRLPSPTGPIRAVIERLFLMQP